MEAESVQGPFSRGLSPLPALCSQCRCISSCFRQDDPLGEFTGSLIKAYIPPSSAKCYLGDSAWDQDDCWCPQSSKRRHKPSCFLQHLHLERSRAVAIASPCAWAAVTLQ